MSINERIKTVRKNFNLTQIEFGSKTGISQGHLTSIESGKRAATEKTIKVICATFNVNENWLRHGIGEMFPKDESTTISQLVAEFNLDEFEFAMIYNYVHLDTSKRKVIKDYVKGIATVMSDEKKSPVGDSDFETAEEIDIDKEMESYKRELEDEKRTKTLPASREYYE